MAKTVAVKTNRNKADKPADQSDNEIFELVEIDGDPKPDPFAALWDDDEQDVTVDLIRVQPETIMDRESNEIVPIAGFLESLPPGLGNYYEYISTKYGGGHYRGTKKRRGTIVTNFNLKVSGRAKLPASHNAAPAKSQPDQNLNLGTVDGINISGTNKEFEAMMQRLMITKKLLADDSKSGIDVNRLLALIVDRPESDPFKMMQSTLAIMNSLKDAADGREPGAGWLDILNNAIDKVGKLIDKHQNGAALPEKRSSGVQHLLEQKAPEAEGGNMPNYQQAAAHAIAQIIASFNLEPRHQPKEAAECIDAVLNFNKEQRSQIKTFKNQLRNLALTELSKQFESDAEMQKDFTAYFDSVFDVFVDPERQTFSFEVKG